MKSLFLTFQFLLGITSISIAQSANNFDVTKFEEALIKQMEITFPTLRLDTTLNFATRARSQAEAGAPECYATKQGGMVNTSNSEEEEAKKLVAAYKIYLNSNLGFDEKSLKRCLFTEFCATATQQYGGLVRYGIVIDNNITRESIIQSSDSLLNGE